MTRVEFLTQEHATLSAECQRERMQQSSWKEDKMQLEKYCMTLQRAMVRAHTGLRGTFMRKRNCLTNDDRLTIPLSWF
jgi:hypothetical protein